MERAQMDKKIVEVSKTIFSYCMAKTRNREEAEDLSQDILYELIRSAENIRDDRAFYGFMWSLAGNVYKHWCRKQAGKQVDEIPDNLPDETEEAHENSDIYLLRRELTLLAEKYRRATILYYIDRKSCSDIAHRLDISESMVKYLLFKARKILKEGINMERKLGTLSYNPKTYIPMYNGSGPNKFWSFMQSKVKQNIVDACYNDSLTADQISLELGIPLPYLEEDIEALCDRKILVKEGAHYKANIMVIDADCKEKMLSSSDKCREKIAEKIEDFLVNNLESFKSIGFIGNDFSENTLRWQLSRLVFLSIMAYKTKILKRDDASELPRTAWGDHAYIWLMEQSEVMDRYLFNYSQVYGRHGDRICFFDYKPSLKGDHHDFYGNERYINIFCDIVRGHAEELSEYDMEAVAEMIRKGYVIKDEDGYHVTTTVFTEAQYQQALNMVGTFVADELGDILESMDAASTRVLSDHTPKYLQDQVKGIAGMDKFLCGVCLPAQILIDKKVLRTTWHPTEMPTTAVILKNE